jgi:hypothetical protein
VPLVLFIGSAYRYFRAKLTEFDDPVRAIVKTCG